ncbi:MAG: sulfotransferase, partial [Cyanobacteria bacterium P01_E01_bin.42]
MNSAFSRFDRDSQFAPIFILGTMPRSGTNFLYNLICLHLDCRGCFIGEDFLVSRSDLLIKYVDSLYQQWPPRWKVRETIGSPNLLCQYIGYSLIEFLNLPASDLSGSPPKRLVTKTPRIRNIEHFFTLFPHAYLLIIIRDGRSVIESGVKSFNWLYEDSIREWADTAQTVLDFQHDMQNTNHKFLIVRYEDIYNET